MWGTFCAPARALGRSTIVWNYAHVNKEFGYTSILECTRVYNLQRLCSLYRYQFICSYNIFNLWCIKIYIPTTRLKNKYRNASLSVSSKVSIAPPALLHISLWKSYCAENKTRSCLRARLVDRFYVRIWLALLVLRANAMGEMYGAI